jgi:protein-tyrosine phosphatase
MIDLHSHILPELDDGPNSLAEALIMAKGAAADGIKVVVATPHQGNGIHVNPPARIFACLQNFRRALDRFAIPLRVVPGAEVRLRPDMAGSVKAGEAMTLLDKGRYLLLEAHAEAGLADIEQEAFGLRLAGITPILAHAERLIQVQEDFEQLASLIRIGVVIQVTAGSLTGDLGRKARECALNLLRHDCVHLLATDAHSAKTRPPRLHGGLQAAQAILGDKRKAQDMVWRTPAAILMGQTLELPEPKPVKRWKGCSWWTRSACP